MTETRLRDRTRYNENPFIDGTNISTVQKRELFTRPNEQIVLNPETNEVSGVGAMLRIRKVDNARFVKIYTENLGMWFELSKNAQRVLRYILTILEVNSASIYFDMDAAKQTSQYTSNAPVYRGLNELVEKSILARSLNISVYYINPSFIFNGNRMIFADAIERGKKRQIDKIHQRGRDMLKSIERQEGIEKKEASSGTPENFREEDW